MKEAEAEVVLVNEETEMVVVEVALPEMEVAEEEEKAEEEVEEETVGMISLLQEVEIDRQYKSIYEHPLL